MKKLEKKDPYEYTWRKYVHYKKEFRNSSNIGKYAEHIERQVMRANKIFSLNLRVEVHSDFFILRGHATNYHLRQLGILISKGHKIGRFCYKRKSDDGRQNFTCIKKY